MVDVRVVRLIRKEIGEQKGKKQDGTKTKMSFLATDYFDVMQVDSVSIEKLDNPLAAIMGIWPAEKPNEDEAVAHSYSLYFNEEMLKQEKGKAWCGNPFAEVAQENVMPILSMIQVYIIPDIMAQALPEASAEVLVDVLYCDLHEAIKEFKEQHPDAVFTLRIYKMLSTGDFAIAIRSSKAEVSFQISAAIRQRKMGNPSDCGGLKLVMYKTYSLLTFSSALIPSEEGKAEGRFVLRGCYSNLYWSRKREIENNLEGKNLWPNTRLFGLNGRYDFSVRIREDEFKELYPLIQKYKEGESIPDISLDQKQDISIVDYMIYLMSKGYLSYVNERCLISQDEWMVQLPETSGYCKMSLSPDVIDNNLLESKINGFYTTVKKKYFATKDKIAKSPAYRKNLMQHTELLGKLVQLCYNINASSDARIYAAVLLEQLDVVIDSIEVYVNMYNIKKQDEDEQENLLDLLEVYIQESVQALDSYAKYIRNCNLQSIQTPNYNLESNMGMEKLLIGYSEMLDIFIKFYQKKYPAASSGGKARAFLPIVVPALHERDMSVEVLFMEGVTKDWMEEKKIWDETNRNEIRHCMVVSVPTLMELGDVRTMTVTLFHEIAHQFHEYETASERNDALLHYIVHTSMGEVAAELAMKMQRELGGYDREDWFEQFLQINLTESYLCHYYKEDGGEIKYPYRDAPLNNFQELLICDLENHLKRKEKMVDFKEHFKDFLRELRYYLIHEEQRYSGAIILMNEITQAKSSVSESGASIIVERIMKCAYVLALECASQNKENTVRQRWEEGDLREWVLGSSTKGFDFCQDWDNHFGIGSCDKDAKEPCGKIWKIFNEFANWIRLADEEILWTPIVSDQTGNNVSREESFYKQAYYCLCNAWEKQADRKETERNSARIREAMGRMLGIDYNSADNEKIFTEELSSVFDQKMIAIKEGAKWRIGKYREETADMMMCNVLNLTPFGYVGLLAAVWPIEKDLLDAYTERFANVFFVQWCLDGQEISTAKVLDECIELVTHLEKMVNILEKDFGLEAKQHEVSRLDDEDMVYEELIEILTDLGTRCEKMCEQTEERYSLEKPKVCRNMAKLIEMFIDYNLNITDYMDECKELKEYFIRGVENYCELNDRMCKDGNPKVQEVGSFCRMIGGWQNDLDEFWIDAEKQRKVNQCSIEFLLNMYYANKRRIAQEVQHKNVI